ncbi:MAG: LacI family DNA-binding transcriptional regulator [Phycisphaeraceae bacterium]|nr:LacI family DNA-binding transcriptional regulator [Phycisphaeraceae bacterium]
MKVTLKQVAQDAGVHYTTVASILNQVAGNSRFSPDTQRRVKEVAQRLGYAPDRDAQRLKTRRTMAIGFLAGDLRNPFFAELAIALEEQLAARGYAMLLASHAQTNPAQDMRIVRNLMGRSVDAMLVWAEGRDLLAPRQVAAQRDRIVWLGWCEGGRHKVHLDIEAGLEQIATHLAGVGHRTVGYYSPTPPRPGMPSHRQILFETIAARHGLRTLGVAYDGASWDLPAASRSGEQAWRHMQAQGVTAAAAYNDIAAMGLLLSRPAALAACPVIGFDGTGLIQSWRPALPHVSFPMTELAQAAAELALHAADNRIAPSKPTRQVVTPTLILPP